MTSALPAGSLRAWSLILTIYGDAVVPRGGSLWLGTLTQIMAAFGIGDGVVRTAMSRLAADGWLERNRVGRNSFYRLADKGQAAFEAATARIYFAASERWDGRLCIAVLDSGEERGAQRAALDEAGFGQLAPGILIGPPTPSAQTPDGVMLLEANAAPEDARRLAARAWPLGRLNADYRRFIAAFTQAGPAANAAGLDSLVLRVRLIHEYRRIILRDPMLPEALLPAEWPGHQARLLCANLYLALLSPSESWLDAHALCETGPLPRPEPGFNARFRDLRHRNMLQRTA